MERKREREREPISIKSTHEKQKGYRLIVQCVCVRCHNGIHAMFWEFRQDTHSVLIVQEKQNKRQLCKDQDRSSTI